MKRLLALVCVMAFATSAFAQEKEVTKVKTTTTTVSSGYDMLGPPLWSVQDAVPLECGRWDLRLGGKWTTASAPANGGDSDDDFALVPHVVFGLVQNVEAWVSVPVWLGDSGDVGPFADGNYDTYLGAMWRFLEQEGYRPAMAIQASARIPTGDGSSGIDGELRLLMTNSYDSGIRSHINLFGATINGNNDASWRYRTYNPTDVYTSDTYPENRNFQWGAIIGLDGPLGSDGKLRWVADYMHRSSYHYGAADINQLELGIEWAVAEGHALGLNGVFGLDDNEDTLNAGAGFAYSYTIKK